MTNEGTLAEMLDRLTAEGELYEHTEDGRIHCYACAHNCVIGEGRRGICKVRYNEGGKLLIPWGYVGALQCDPVEKKPYFHVLPGSDALTFGMLGCDLHCGYCFTGDTPVLTDRGPLAFEDVFNLAERVDRTPGAEIAFPDGLRAVAASGALRAVRGVFCHHYRGPLLTIKPFYLPALRCTPEHRVYATTSPEHEPQPTRAELLSEQHYLTIPRACAPSSGLLRDIEHALRAEERVLSTDRHYLVPIRTITAEDFDGPVYNMEVEEEHNYLAGFFLVSNCQNHITSQALRDKNAGVPPRPVGPDELVLLGQAQGARLVVSSYNEPLITAEWGMAVFKEAKARGLLTGFVSNGNATREVLEYIRPWTDCYKIDLKSMSDRSYRQLGTRLESVLGGIRMVHELGFWLEVLTLVVPGFNDSDAELRDAAQFIASISPDIPWHVTAFHKDYKMTENDDTTANDLLRAVEIGREAGLRYVYAGNLPGRVGEWENTRCPSCSKTLVRRTGYLILDYQLTPEGACPACATPIPGIWPQGGQAEVRLSSELNLFSRRPRPINRLRSDLPDEELGAT
jgi:pyruvate formate lyase activating enzyme